MGILRLDFLLAILAVAIATKVFLSRKKFPLPPGPKGLPVLGNLYDLPRSHGCLVYERWGREFSTVIIHLSLCAPNSHSVPRFGRDSSQASEHLRYYCQLHSSCFRAV